MEKECQRLTTLRVKAIRGINERIEHVRLNGHITCRLPNNINVSIESVDGESLLLNLDMEGIAASTGSACSSSTLEISNVLQAIGLPPETARSSLRFTTGRYTEEKDIDCLLEVLPKAVDRLRTISVLH
jgi:cysteine desulfurase